MKKLVFISLIILTVFSACENADWEFADYDYTTVYFAYQTPVRTIVLGEDLYDNSLDNAHKCKIMATMGGVYENQKDRIIDFSVDNSICNYVTFEADGSDVQPMPAEYYSLAGNQITIPSGSIAGGVEVQLTDAFFADPNSIKNTYVIPLVMNSVQNADSILSGESLIPDANPFIADQWAAVPKNLILYCVKYVNPYHGAYLRRGIDVGIGNAGNTALDTTAVYHNQYVERDQVVYMNTLSMDEVSMELTTKDKGNEDNIPFELRVKFAQDGNCVIAAPDDATYSITGSGKLVADGDMWGNEKRDVIYMDYQIDFGTSTHSFTDTIVMRDRQVAFETFVVNEK